MLHQFSQWVMSPGVLGVICMAQVACLCAIYGGVLSAVIRKQLKPRHFFVRVTGFVLMHAFIFGAIGALLAAVAAGLYRLVPAPWPPFAMLGAFMLIGLLAEKSRRI